MFSNFNSRKTDSSTLVVRQAEPLATTYVTSLFYVFCFFTNVIVLQLFIECQRDNCYKKIYASLSISLHTLQQILPSIKIFACFHYAYNFIKNTKKIIYYIHLVETHS